MDNELIRLPEEHGSRFYKTHTGLRLPSVTTILSQTVAKPALIPWAAKMERAAVLLAVTRSYDEMAHVMKEVPPLDVFQEMIDGHLDKEKAFKKELKKAGNIGTEVHSRIEWEFRGELGDKKRKEEPPPLSTPEAKRSFERAIEWRKQTRLKVLGVERKVASLQERYAGTLDALVQIDDDEGNTKVGVVDFKSSKAVYDEHLLQNCAYRLALAEQGIKTDAGWIILLPKISDDDAFKVVEVPPMSTLITPWLAAVSLYRWIAEQRKAMEG